MISLIFKKVKFFIGFGKLDIYVCFIPSPVRVGTLHFGGSWGPIGLRFFEFEQKPTGKEGADPSWARGGIVFWR